MADDIRTPPQGWGGAPYLFPRRPINLDAPRLNIGYPPGAHIAPAVNPGTPDISHPNGVPSVNGIPLTVIGGSARDLAFTDPGLAPGTAVPGAIDVTDSSRFGDAKVIALIFAGAGGMFNVLPRPATKRIELLIVNSTVVGQIFYNFDQQADNASSVPIGAGGNRLWDAAVPQNNLSIFSSGAGTVILEYMNSAV
jgi:hypothetical protein